MGLITGWVVLSLLVGLLVVIASLPTREQRLRKESHSKIKQWDSCNGEYGNPKDKK